MKTLVNKLKLAVAVLSVTTFGLMGGVAHATNNASFSLSPASTTVNAGSTFSIGVYENGNGNAVSAVTAVLNYDQSALQIMGASCGGAFGSSVQANGGGGTATLSCYTPPGSTAPTDGELVGTLSFKALAGSGSTSLTFQPYDASTGGGSVIADNGVNAWDGNTAGGSYNLATPAPAPTRSTESTTPTPTPAPTPAVKAASTKKTPAKSVTVVSAATKKNSYAGEYLVLAVVLIAAIAYETRRRMVMNGKEAALATNYKLSSKKSSSASKASASKAATKKKTSKK